MHRVANKMKADGTKTAIDFPGLNSIQLINLELELSKQVPAYIT